MTFSSAAPLVQMAWNGQADEATIIACQTWKKWQDDKPSADGVADIYKKVGALRANLGLVPQS